MEGVTLWGWGAVGWLAEKGTEPKLSTLGETFHPSGYHGHHWALDPSIGLALG